MKLKVYPNLFSQPEGFSLVEVTMALGLVSFCLVAMLGLLPVGLKGAKTSSEQLTALQVLLSVENDYRAATTQSSTHYGIPLSSGTGTFFVDNAFKKTNSAANAEYTIWYDVTNGTSSRMHVFVSRALPTDSTAPELSSLGTRDFVESVFYQQME